MNTKMELRNIKANLVMQQLRVAWYLVVKQLIRRCDYYTLPRYYLLHQGVIMVDLSWKNDKIIDTHAHYSSLNK
jgi:hypothetical protein